METKISVYCARHLFAFRLKYNFEIKFCHFASFFFVVEASSVMVFNIFFNFAYIYVINSFCYKKSV